jgi:hypothetical protein
MKLIKVNIGGKFRTVPVPKDPVKALRGMFKGLKLTESLLKDRREEAARDTKEARLAGFRRDDALTTDELLAWNRKRRAKRSI